MPFAMVSAYASNDAGHRMSELIDTEDENRRSRVSLACTRCRLRKDRCDGLKPSCTACRNAEKPCVYEAATKKRGLPEGYVRGLEKLFAIASQSIDGLEDVLIKCLQDDMVKRCWNSTAAEEIHSSNWKDSRLHHELEVLLSNTGNTTGTKRKRDREEDAPDDPGTMLDNLKQLCYRVVEDQDVEQAQPVPAPVPIASPTQNTSTSTKTFPPDSSRLFDLYFTHVHCWFPILTRPTVLKAYYECSRRSSTPNSDGNRALLWAILAYAVMLDNTANVTKFRDSHRFETYAFSYLPIYDRTSVNQDNSELLLGSRYSNNNAQDKPSTRGNGVNPHIGMSSETLFSNKLEGSSIVHAQSLLILALLQLGKDCKLKSWTMVAAAKCILLAHQQISVATKPVNGALQGCALLTSYFHHDFQIREPVVLNNAIDEDGHEEWETWGPTGQLEGPSFSLSVFNKFCRVLQIMSDHSRSIREKHHEIRLVEAELLDAGIPPVAQSASPPHHIYIQLMLLHSKFVLTAVGSSIERQELATQTFNLLDLCTSPKIGLDKVPPLLSEVLDLACNEACLASRQDLIERGTTLAAQLSRTWPVFELRGYGSVVPPVPEPVIQENPLDVLKSFRNRSQQFLPITTNTLNLQTDESLSNSVEDTLTSQSQNQWVQTPPTQLSGGTPVGQFEVNRSPNYSHGSARHNSFGQHNSWANIGNFVQGARSASFPVPSPSFQGDEIDAIFHEMAHLDTNEWTNERALGLREFGFNDDSAFVEFCNDPERLALPAGTSSLPLSSTRQSWTFAAQPP